MDTALREPKAITIFIEDLARSKHFYEEIFDAKVVNEDEEAVAYDFGSIIVNLLRSSAAPELIEPAEVGDPGAGAHFVMTLEVSDVDAVCEELGVHGVELINGPMDRPWGIRTASFADPDGTIWEVAQKQR